MKKLCWLASYPKSGNTWLRYFLANLSAADNKPISLNSMRNDGAATSKNFISEHLGIELSDLNEREISRLQRLFYLQLNSELNSTRWFKLHDAFRYTVEGRPLFPPEVTAATVHIVRNPLDIVASLSNHLNCNYDQAIDFINNRESRLDHSNHTHTWKTPQLLYSWSAHVKSWLEAEGMNVLTLRYEDILDNPSLMFSRVIQHLDIDVSEAQFSTALSHSQFSTMQERESREGFVEKDKNTSLFFRQGLSGGWRNELSKKQITRITTANTEMMERLSYLY